MLKMCFSIFLWLKTSLVTEQPVDRRAWVYCTPQIEPLLIFISSQCLSSSESLQHTVKSCLDKYSTDVYSVQEETSGPGDERGRYKMFYSFLHRATKKTSHQVSSIQVWDAGKELKTRQSRLLSETRIAAPSSISSHGLLLNMRV